MATLRAPHLGAARLPPALPRAAVRLLARLQRDPTRRQPLLGLHEPRAPSGRRSRSKVCEASSERPWSVYTLESRLSCAWNTLQSVPKCPKALLQTESSLTPTAPCISVGQMQAPRSASRAVGIMSPQQTDEPKDTRATDENMRPRTRTGYIQYSSSLPENAQLRRNCVRLNRLFSQQNALLSRVHWELPRADPIRLSQENYPQTQLKMHAALYSH